MSVQETYLKEIADAIRAKEGTTEAIPANTFAERIASLSGGENHDVEDGIITREISGEYRNDRVVMVGEYGFSNCSALTTVDFPLLTDIGNYGFSNCSALTTVDFPKVTSIGNNAFYKCSALTTADFPKVTSIGTYAFYNCSALTSLLLRNTEGVCTPSNINAFSSTPIKSGAGYIYVPSALLDDYKAATNWSTYADQFRALEDYTVDGTTTGALDESKI